MLWPSSPISSVSHGFSPPTQHPIPPRFRSVLAPALFRKKHAKHASQYLSNDPPARKALGEREDEIADARRARRQQADALAAEQTRAQVMDTDEPSSMVPAWLCIMEAFFCGRWSARVMAQDLPLSGRGSVRRARHGPMNEAQDRSRSSLPEVVCRDTSAWLEMSGILWAIPFVLPAQILPRVSHRPDAFFFWRCRGVRRGCQRAWGRNACASSLLSTDFDSASFRAQRLPPRPLSPGVDPPAIRSERPRAVSREPPTSLSRPSRLTGGI